MAPELMLDMFSLFLLSLVVLKPQCKVKLMRLVGLLFVFAICLKYLTEFKEIGLAIQVFSTIFCFAINCFHLNRQARS